MLLSGSSGVLRNPKLGNPKDQRSRSLIAPAHQGSRSGFGIACRGVLSFGSGSYDERVKARLNTTSFRAYKLLTPNTTPTQLACHSESRTSSLHHHRYIVREARGIGSAAFKGQQSCTNAWRDLTLSFLSALICVICGDRSCRSLSALIHINPR